MYILCVIFEFDVAKSARNKLKHGIDFVEAQELWSVPAVVVRSDRGDEVRYARIALHSDARLWTASIHTAEQTPESSRCGQPAAASANSMNDSYPKTEQELIERIDAGEDLESLGFDVANAKVEEPKLKRVNVDFPEVMLAMLDREAALRGINRQALIKSWLYDRLMASRKTTSS